MGRSILRLTNRLAAGLVDLVLPQFCGICGPCVEAGLLPNLCDRCAAELKLADGNVQCRVCGLPLVGFHLGRGRCLGCFRKRVPWRRLAVLGPYEGLLAELICRLKFAGERGFAVTLGELMAAQAESLSWTNATFDVVCVIPLTPARERKRGFNQAALIGKYVAQALEIPLETSWLRRSGDGGSQVGHDANARKTLSGSVFTASSEVFGRRVLLIDDVVTTQGTIKAASGTLRGAGTLDIQILCCARTSLRQHSWSTK